MIVHFRDSDPEVIDELRKAVDGVSLPHGVTFTVGDIFGGNHTFGGGEVYVSPANSFGYMDGGIDAVYVRRFGRVVEDSAKREAGLQPFGELLVGKAACLFACIGASVIMAPTMRVPGPTTAGNVFLAARAAFSVAASFGGCVCPGLGTLTGRVPKNEAAKAMLQGLVEAHRFASVESPSK